MAVTLAEYIKDAPSFEEFFAFYVKSQEEYAERQKKLEALMEETEKKINKLSENLGGLNRSIGELIETLIAARLWEKFPEYDLQRAYRRLPLYDEKNQQKGEIDILLVNTEWAMAVEVKREADERDIDRHIERMARILKYLPSQFVPGKKLLAAIAGGAITEKAKDYAHELGFYVLELAGESVVRVSEPLGFKPKEWN